MDRNTSVKQISILLADDDEEDYLIIKHLFKSIKDTPFTLEWVATSDKAIEKILLNEYDIYLIDYRIDQRTGLDILEEVDAAERSEPFILLTGMESESVERESLRAAASDYIVKKNLTSEQLSRAVYYALGRKEQERSRMERLLQLNESKDEFISIASHQLRTPATIVKQYVAMVLDGYAGDITESQRKLLKKAYDNNEHQLMVVNDLLKVAQIDSGTVEMSLRRLDVSKLLKEMGEHFEVIFKDRNQILEVSVDKTHFARVDENALRMIIDNLLENASKYSPEKTTTVLSIEGAGDSLHISVTDEGVGVTDTNKLFQKFSRINNELSTKVGGTGLGLYWARAVAQMHGGDLTYEANRSHGSIFTLTIPIYSVK